MNLNNPWPISYADVAEARGHIAPYLSPTPLRRYPRLERWLDRGIECWVKLENHQPTGSFKVRNGLNAVGQLSASQREKGIISATRGNHGQGLAFAGRALGSPVTICVPEGNSPAKNQAMIDLGAELIVVGNDYDASAQAANEIAEKRGLTIVHSTNNRGVIAGAATMTAEILDQQPDVDAMVVAVGGGSQAVGALTVARGRRPAIDIFAVQAAAASAAHDGFFARRPVTVESANTFADGLATRSCYEMTFPTLLAGLAGFVAVDEESIKDAVRTYLRETNNLAEGAGACGLAGLFKLRDELAEKRVAIIISGGNIDIDILAEILAQR